ncbi:2-hydroxychromene-2-carboxylate isomerase [Sphingomonas radiodurans]|uniref:2-hydroxychromene-2-carboxylate isomerase n=1 Tax=Sphingomonas radiodurans TaxID=2890321 RepID=UPI001E452087|nr:2-hydroxychromene-2-carboxylate isomerase [Sphingomonas radiodurans]WBH16109.1 2-hydroxychromene-2-carboxylate isomerase [Sphingomonas radiodurans]
MIEFFFDCSSPWTWLGFESIQPLGAELEVEIIWRPILVGGVFNAVNASVYEGRKNPVPAKARYMLKDMQDWARLQGLSIKFPPSIFPVNSVKVMRACCWLGQDCVPFARAAFRAYWTDDRDIADDAVIADVASAAGVDAAALFAAIATDPVKAQLRANTDELIARGGFGSPTIFVGGDEMYFGNDRMPLVRAAVERRLNGIGSVSLSG